MTKEANESDVENLTKEAIDLVRRSTDEQFKDMVFFWHGEEFLAERLIESIKDCFSYDDIDEFVGKFKDKRK